MKRFMICFLKWRSEIVGSYAWTIAFGFIRRKLASKDQSSFTPSESLNRIHENAESLLASSNETPKIYA
jgi:hypothetical protein